MMIVADDEPKTCVEEATTKELMVSNGNGRNESIF